MPFTVTFSISNPSFRVIWKLKSSPSVTSFTYVAGRVKQHNLSSDAIAIEYHTGIAMNSKEHMEQITNLIALANKRIYENS